MVAVTIPLVALLYSIFRLSRTGFGYNETLITFSFSWPIDRLAEGVLPFGWIQPAVAKFMMAPYPLVPFEQNVRTRNSKAVQEGKPVNRKEAEDTPVTVIQLGDEACFHCML